MLQELHFANGKEILHSFNDEVSLNQLFVVSSKVSAFTFFVNKQFICSLSLFVGFVKIRNLLQFMQ